MLSRLNEYTVEDISTIPERPSLPADDVDRTHLLQEMLPRIIDPYTVKDTLWIVGELYSSDDFILRDDFIDALGMCAKSPFPTVHCRAMYILELIIRKERFTEKIALIALVVYGLNHPDEETSAICERIIHR